ncbi:MAG TPA: ATP-binding protein, partial [Bacteroidota bacterium]|nr:ATP-binding protein [Bacteroidota bacterium]
GLIDAMNDIVWAVDPKNDSFEFLLLRMKTHAARMLDAKGINYEIDIPDELSRLHLPLGFRRRFYLIYKEAINNILRHAHAAKVTLTIRKEGRSLVMTIVDDGKGFDLERVREGNGLTNMRKRAESLNGELTISSRPGSGTTVTLKARIP